MKKRKMLYLNEKIYNDFKIFCIISNTNVSAEVEKFMKEVLDKRDKKNREK